MAFSPAEVYEVNLTPQRSADTDRPYTVELINQSVEKIEGAAYIMKGNNCLITNGKKRITCYI